MVYLLNMVIFHDYVSHNQMETILSISAGPWFPVQYQRWALAGRAGGARNVAEMTTGEVTWKHGESPSGLFTLAKITFFL